VRKHLVLAIAVVAIMGTSLTVAVATPGSRASRTPISRAAVLVSEEDAVTFKSGLDSEVLKVVIEPGGSSGWHSHPSPGIFLVDKGTMTNYGLDGAPCKGVKVTAGQGYYVSQHPHHAHLVRNEGTETLEVTVTYFNVPSGEPTRIDAQRPAECPDDLK
jgi:quercetin dioxygenase-like cupin family protein